jgi:anaerobic selenocysteine-containing dehydrogenase/Fe-S-cluster-containing dehydrogenase component
MSDEEVQPTIDRRKFLTVLGVTGGTAAVLSGCSTDRIEKLVPYLVQSEDQVPGLPTIYASSCTECSAGCGLHVKTREGRAIKLEGNPDHPVNRGKLCALGQSSLQALYNPARLKGPLARNGSGALEPVAWDAAITLLAQKASQSNGRLGVISGAGRGTFSDLLADWAGAMGGRVVRYQAFDHEALRTANAKVFGIDQLPTHNFAPARYLVSFGAEFLENWLSPLENARGFADARTPRDGQAAKHVFFSHRMSLTGMNADEWLVTRPGGDTAVALALGNIILTERRSAPGDANGLRAALAAYTPDMAAQESGVGADVIRRVAREFASASPSLAVAGGIGNQHRGSSDLCAAVNLLNYIAGNVGRTVNFGADLDHGDGYGALESLVLAMGQGQVGVLLVHEANPVHTSPRSLGFAEGMKKVGFKVSTSMFLDETSALCDLIIPNHHALERWDDARPRSGVTNLMQPVMEPVFGHKQGEAGTMATGDVLLKVAQKAGGPLARFSQPSFEAYLKAAFAGAIGGADADLAWRQALQRGGVFKDSAAAIQPPRLAAGAGQVSYTRPTFDGDGDFIFTTFPISYGDGRGANRPWLLELPDPVTRVTWHSWVEIHPDTAREMNVREGEILRLTSATGTIEAPAYVYAGIHPGTVGVPLGLGHTEYGDWARGRGTNALDLLGGRDGNGFLPYLATRVKVEKTGSWIQVAKTEGTTRQLGRGIASAMTIEAVRQGLTLEQVEKNEGHGREEANTDREVEALRGFRQSQVEKTKHGAYAEQNPQWGMVNELARCTGCSAGDVACYSENNFPWGGEEEVRRGREMSWMRIERYWEGGENGEPLEPRVIPMLCQHCGNAPCEPVCPVYASYHTADGLNGQVYNRCVGTRYCSNNCPYKVRYFNWFAYGKKAFPEPLNLQLNPDVVVRARGVMEKCTFCVQRIRAAQNSARLDDRPLVDGDVVTACAQACPSDAIVFGNRVDPDSRVSKAAEDRRGYHVLEDTNTRSAITYLAKVLHRSEA